jgi:hypothetical protein
MKLFDLDKNGNIIPQADTLCVPAFKLIWDRDKDKNKSVALKELTYLYLAVDYQSPYTNFPIDKKESIIIKDLFDKGWKPDVDLLKAKKFYIEANQTHSLRLLESARYACDKLSDYFNKVNFAKTDDNHKFLFNVDDVANNISKIGKIIESLDIVESKLKTEQSSNTKVMGGKGKIGAYER